MVMEGAKSGKGKGKVSPGFQKLAAPGEGQGPAKRPKLQGPAGEEWEEEKLPRPPKGGPPKGAGRQKPVLPRPKAGAAVAPNALPGQVPSGFASGGSVLAGLLRPYRQPPNPGSIAASAVPASGSNCGGCSGMPVLPFSEGYGRPPPAKSAPTPLPITPLPDSASLAPVAAAASSAPKADMFANVAPSTKWAFDAVHQPTKPKEVRGILKWLGSKEALADPDAIPHMTQLIRKRYLSRFDTRAVFTHFAEVFMATKAVAHRKSIVYCVSEMVSRGQTTEKWRPDCLHSFLIPIGARVRGFNTEERASYVKLAHMWDKWDCMAKEDLQLVKDAWDLD